MVDEQVSNASVETQATPSEPASQPTQTIESNVSTQAESQETPKQKKVFDEDQMRIISNDVKRRTEEKLRAEFEAKYNPQAQKKEENTDNISQTSYTAEQVRTIIREEQQKAIDSGVNSQLESNFVAKISPLIEANPAFAEKLVKLGFDKIDPVANKDDAAFLRMLNSLDNVGDVMLDIADNPRKLIEIESLYYKNPEFALSSLIDLSSSLKRNKDALAKEKAPIPSSQLQPSTVGLGNGIASISTIRRTDKSVQF